MGVLLLSNVFSRFWDETDVIFFSFLFSLIHFTCSIENQGVFHKFQGFHIFTGWFVAHVLFSILKKRWTSSKMIIYLCLHVLCDTSALFENTCKQTLWDTRNLNTLLKYFPMGICHWNQRKVMFITYSEGKIIS